MVISRFFTTLALNSMCRAMDKMPQTEVAADAKRHSPGMFSVGLREAVEEEALVLKFQTEFATTAEKVREVMDYFVHCKLLGRAEKDGKKYIFHR